jgi:hypothetical protein
MTKSFAIPILMAFVASTALLAGCQTKTGVNDGSGYAFTRLKPVSRDFLIANDRPAAEVIAGNNRQCNRDKQCRK